jgi:endonuclease YncB( thermonuclease family)
MPILATLAVGACITLAVHDGDTLSLKCASRVNPIKLRIMEIDAPEMAAFTWKTQPWAVESRNQLSDLCLNQPTVPSLIRYDARTSRWVGRAKCNGVDVASYQINHGNAQAYLWSKNSKIPALQEAAHAKGVGLWSLPDPQTPAAWRKGASC